MKLSLRALAACLCAALLLFSFASCGTSAGDLLAYQSRAMSLTVAYEAGGIPVEATLDLGAGDSTRDLTLTITSPEEAVGLTITRTAGSFHASHGTHTLPVADLSLAVAPLSFFTIPSTCTVADIKKEGDTRTILLADGDATWHLYMADGDIPVRIDYTRGDTFRTIRISPAP